MRDKVLHSMGVRTRTCAARSGAAVLHALLTLAFLTPGPAIAQNGLPEVVSRLPAEVEFVLALDDAATLRQQIGGDPVVGWIRDTPHLTRVADAWAALASGIGMADTEAFDLLLGRRVILAASGLRSGDTPRWAVLSELDEETARRLRRDLGAKPRRVLAGQHVFELEGGAFLLATSPGALRCGAADLPPVKSPHVLLLAPTDDKAFFASLLPLLWCNTAPTPLSTAPGGADTAALRPAQGVFYWRIGDAKGIGERFISGTLGRAGNAWNMQFLAGPSGSWIAEDPAGLGEPWKPTLLDALPGDPALVVLGMRELVDRASSFVLPLHPGAAAAGGQEEIARLLGKRSMVALWRDEQPGSRPPEVLFATEARDVRALSREGDQLITDNLSRLGARSPGSVPDIGAGQPTVVRSVTLQPESLVPTSDAVGASLHWMYLPKDEPASSGEGWWIVHYDPDESRAKIEREYSRRLGTRTATEARRYLHIGHARPGLLLDLLPYGALAPPESKVPRDETAVLQFAKRIERLDWSFWRDDADGPLRGEIVLEPASARGR